MSDENLIDESIHLLTAAYALDALSDEERVEFAAHLEECDACATETAELIETASRLALLTEAPAPDHLRATILGAVSRTAQLARPSADAPGVVVDLDARRRARRRWVASVGGALAAAAAIATAVVLSQDDPAADILAASDARRISGEVVGGGEARLVVSDAEDGGVVTFAGLPDPGEGRVYQMWLIDGTDAVPEDTFAPSDGSASVLLEGAPDVDAVALTVEPEGGSDAPTTDPIAVIPLDG